MTLRLAGVFTVLRDGRPDSAAGLGSRKARALLKLLAVERGHHVPVDRLVDILWDAHPPARPAENVATLVSRLRAALGSGAILGGRDGYRLGDPPAILVDLDEAAAHLAEAERRLADGELAFASLAAGRALQLLGDGSALADEAYAEWAEPARIELADLARRARHAAAEAANRSGDHAEAVTIAGKAVEADPFDEVACRLLMRAHAGRGEPARAVAAYERLRAILAFELGTDPAPDTRALHVSILREEPAPPEHTTPKSATKHAGRTELAGRESEQRQLDAVWAKAVSGQSAIVLVTGEAGIGKTKLATHTIEWAEQLGATIMRARCYDAERSLFLQPMAEMLADRTARMSLPELTVLVGDRAAALAALVPAVTRLGGPAAVGGGHAEVQRRMVFEAVAGLLRDLTERTPVLVFIDDLHSSGLSTVELLHYLGRTLSSARLLVVATVRVEEGEQALRMLEDVAIRLDLGRLPAEAVRQLAAAAGHAEMAEQIERQTRGHALYVMETLRGLAAGETGVPKSLQAAVLARVHRAGESVEGLLRTASVVGATLDPVVLARLTSQTTHTVARQCEQALAARLLLVAGRAYEFANDLIREVLYATTPEPTRVAYHLRAAELLDGHPEAVAEHAAAAGDWHRAGRAFLVAGEEATRRFAAGDAHTLLDRALAAARNTGATSYTAVDRELIGRIHVARGRVREILTHYDLALSDLRDAVEAARDAGDRRLEMIALRELAGDVPVALGLPIGECVEHLQSGLRIAEALGDRGVEASLLGRLAVLAANQLRLSDAVEYGLRGVAAGRGSGDDRALAAGLDGLKTAYFFLGEIGPLDAVTEELEPLARRLGDLWRLQWTMFESAFAPYARGDWEAASTRMESALEVNRRSGYAAYEAWFVAHLGRLEQLRGRDEVALALGRRSVEVAGGTRHPWWQATTHTLLAATLLEQGETEAAVTLLHRAREVGIAGAQAHLSLCTALLAEATGSRDVLDEADALLRKVVAPDGGAWLFGADAYLAAARAWLGLSEPRRARDVIRPMLDAARRVPWVAAYADGLLVDGRARLALTDPGALDQIAESAALAERHGLPHVAREARTALHGDG